MTREEREEHRAKMYSLKTREERETFRIEYHKKMQERAAKMGKTLPDMQTTKGCGADALERDVVGRDAPNPDQVEQATDPHLFWKLLT